MINSYNGEGRTTKPVITNKNKTVALLTLAVDHNYKDKDGNVGAEFIPIKVFHNVENIAKFDTKGSLISVQGTLNNNNYTDKNGNKVFSMAVHANHINFLDLKSHKESQKQTDQTNNFKQAKAGDIDHDPFRNSGDQIELSDDDLPF